MQVRNIRLIAFYLSILLSLFFFVQAGFITAKAQVAQWLLENAWQKASSNKAIDDKKSHQVLPWAWADIYPVAKLSFEQQKTSHIVLNNDSGQALAFGPGITHSAQLLGSENNTTIISAHRDTHFSILEDVQVGDNLRLEVIGSSIINLSVTNRYIIDTRAETLLIEREAITDKQRLILVTCFPFDSVESATPYRLIIEAE